MPQARLLHPINVVIEMMDRNNTEYDPRAKEPIRQVSRKNQVQLKAQVLWIWENEQKKVVGGITLGDDGYLLFEQRDLDALGIVLQPGDKIVQIGTLTNQSLFFTKFRPMGHYPGGHQLLRGYFEERRPTQYSNPYEGV
jgi:hypothetical protein